MELRSEPWAQEPRERQEGGCPPLQIRTKSGEKFGQNGKKIRTKKVRKKLKCGTEKAKKLSNVYRLPGTASACAGFLEEGFKTWTAEIYV